MSNTISYRHRNDLPALTMSNGLTAVLIAVLALAASNCASTDRHKVLAIWLATHDQSVCGNGMAGFDLEDLPWRGETINEDKSFLLDVVGAAQAKRGWELLDYVPREDWVQASLAQLSVLISAFAPEHIGVDHHDEGGQQNQGEHVDLCTRHHIYLHPHGCVICNEG